MSRTSRAAFYCVILASALLCAPLFGADKMKEPVPAAPAPAQIVAGRKVFLAYAGINTISLAGYIVDVTGAPNGLYDELYATIKHWDGYQLVSAPADADLVFNLSISQVRGEDPILILKILDPKTNVLLWAFMENVGGGSGREAARRKAWDESLASLGNQVRELAAQPVGPMVNK
jgi:hypothetical protein